LSRLAADADCKIDCSHKLCSLIEGARAWPRKTIGQSQAAPLANL
jgi:hypothetical protein